MKEKSEKSVKEAAADIIEQAKHPEINADFVGEIRPVTKKPVEFVGSDDNLKSVKMPEIEWIEPAAMLPPDQAKVTTNKGPGIYKHNKFHDMNGIPLKGVTKWRIRKI